MRRTITLGTQLTTTLRTGHRVRCKVTAIRNAPFCYVELKPLAGGERRAVPLRVAEMLLREEICAPLVPSLQHADTVGRQD
ncbi:hypothetical protein GCM10023147_07430 [Tsukamurella soli]|uniref:Uncharacterized protein n=1 Tax=Tsukamurella soli TaxID=644556 RepID=A0ABP8J698_9ACTN